MELFWASEMKEQIGNAYGYYVHNRNLKKYVSEVVKLCTNPDNATDAIYIVSPEFFKGGLPRAWNYLFTMFEGDSIPDRYKEGMDKADYLLAPSTFVKNLFDQYFPEDMTFVVPHGVEKKFKFKKRRFPTNLPFRFLWVGAPNPRKGWQEIMVVWESIFKGDPRVQLYIKTTRVKGRQKKSNVVLDGRNLPDDQLIKLYHTANCFLFPTRGEGFGLTLAEAMRTGLPCISTRYSGEADFFDDKVGYVIRHEMGDGEVKFIGDNTTEKTRIALPDVQHLAEQMIYVYHNYNEALRKGARASKRISNKFTWERSARTLISIIKSNAK